MQPVNMRAIERILAVIIGGICIYLGYSLFLHIPELKEGEGTFKLPGGISILITRVGPGVFFALFGAGIVALALYRSVVYRTEGPEGSQMYGGLTPQHTARGGESLDRDRLRLVLEIEFLNMLPSLLRTDLSDERRRELPQRITSTKLALMQTVWGPDWGDFDEFGLWAESGALDPIPKGLETAAAYYRSGQEATQ
jgi:hypothetical protein